MNITGYHKPPQIRPEQETGTNSRIVKQALASWKLPRVDTKDTEAIEKRINEYLEYCIKQDVAPSVAGVCNWLKISVRLLEYWYTGQRGTAEHQKIATQFYGVLQEIWITDMKEGNINPVSGIFVGKVFFGYRDQQEIVINTKTQEQELTTQQLIEESRLLPHAEPLSLPSDIEKNDLPFSIEAVGTEPI